MDTNEPLVTLIEMAKRERVTVRRINRWCTRGRKSVAGKQVLLERWKSEYGWATTHSAVVRFRQRLNDLTPTREDAPPSEPAHQ